MIRKLGAILVALALVLSIGLVPGVALASSTVEPYDPNGMILYAGQHIPVGTVTVTNDSEQICVTYELDADVAEEGWVFTELHLHIAGEAEGLPTNRQGNPIPGHFDHKAYFDLDDEETWYEFCMDLDDLGVHAGDPVYIAAHAVVEKPEVLDTLDDCIVSDTDTLYYDESEHDWFESHLTWVHPSWPTNGQLTGASWIWESYYVQNPRDGDVLQFEREFEVLGTPVDGTLWITADNKYAVELNGVTIGDNAVWSTVTEYDVTDELLDGENTLTITAENLPWNTDDPEVNPGGVIYRLRYDYDVVIEEHKKESAWADGTRFVRRGNWATYFMYEVQFTSDWIDDLVLWLDASALTLGDGASVETWQDLSGGEKHATGYGHPIYKPYGLNNRPVVSFDGENDYAITEPLDEHLNHGGWTVFAVIKPYVEFRADPDFPHGMWAGITHGPNYTNGFLIAHTRFLAGLATTPSTWVSRGYSLDDEAGQILTVGHDEFDKKFSFYKNGVSFAADLAYNDELATHSNSRVYLMSRGTNFSRLVKGDIAEILIYNRALDEDEREAVEAYLMAKYGL